MVVFQIASIPPQATEKQARILAKLNFREYIIIRNAGMYLVAFKSKTKEKVYLRYSER